MSLSLSEIVTVERADVYKRGALAATLLRTKEGVEFRYLPDYVRNNGVPIATTLPVTTEPQLTPAGAVPPYFAGLLPEGRRLSALRRAVKSSADDDLSLLLAVGADTIGDVQVLPEGVRPHEVAPVVEVSDFTRVRFTELFVRSVGQDPDRVGIPGIQDKVSARMITLPVAKEGDRFILKLNPPEFPALVENEAFFIEAGRACGLSTVDARVVRDAKNVPGLLVRRFDRVLTADGSLLALGFEDGCQVLDRYPADKYVVTGEQVGTALSAVSDARPVAARELLRQFAFAYLSANGDAHAKNFAVVQQPDGEWRVSPAFDLPSSYPYGDSTLALSIQHKRREDVTRKDFLEFGTVLGVPERATTRMLDGLCGRADIWLDRLEELPFDAGRIRKLRRAIEYRRSRLRGI